LTPLPKIRAIAHLLHRGGVIAYPTESCYGLGCDPRNARAVTKILRLKGRPRGRGLLLVGSAFRQFARYLAPVAEPVASRFRIWWPGPTSLLLPASRRCPRWLRGRHDKLAVRITAHPDTARLCHALNMALVSTSANQSGRRPLKTAAACKRHFGSRVRVISGRIGRRKRPSTILDPVSGEITRA
jgi:L-threonylcarbamoyladenylate synthase